MPNQCWQSDFTHYPLAGGADTKILAWLDDHSRYALSVTAHARVTRPERIRYHLRRPVPGRRDLLTMTAGNTVRGALSHFLW